MVSPTILVMCQYSRTNNEWVVYERYGLLSPESHELSSIDLAGIVESVAGIVAPLSFG